MSCLRRCCCCCRCSSCSATLSSRPVLSLSLSASVSVLTQGCPIRVSSGMSRWIHYLHRRRNSYWGPGRRRPRPLFGPCGLRLSLARPFLSPVNTRPFNGPFSGTTRVSRYQKGKTNLDFTEARDIEWRWHQLGHM